MFGTAFTTLTGIFDKRFILNALLPTILGALITILIWEGTGEGFSAGIDRLDDVSGVTASIVAIVSVGVLTAIAVILSSQSGRLSSWYAGYTGPLASALGSTGRSYWRKQQTIWEAQRSDTTSAWPHDAWLRVPREPGRVSATALGTMGNATAQHLLDRFGIAVDRMWPLLSTQLDSDALTRIEAAESSIEQLLALATISTLSGIAGAIIAAEHRAPFLASFAIGLIGFALAFAFYRASLAPSRSWSDMVRSAFELHRLDLLDALTVPRPLNSTQERALWQRLDSVLLAQDDRPYALAATPPKSGSDDTTASAK